MPRKTSLIIRIARMTYAKILCANGKVQIKNECGADLKKYPYLILSNHVGIMDPVMITARFPQHIRWVAGAYLFKTKFLHKVIGEWCAAIPKQQGQNDISTFRAIHRALKDGDNVGLFPEGTRTWDGEMMPIGYLPLAKLIRMYKVPVLFVHLEGGYAHSPRWADHDRRGPVIVNFKYMIDPLQAAQMDVRDLAATVKEYLHFSNDEWKETVDYQYVSSRRAEGLQRLLYMCPICKSVDSLSTKGNRVVCRSCNTNTVLNDKDDLTSIDIPFTKLSQWHQWEAEEIGSLSEFPKEKGVLLQKGDNNDEGELEELSTNFTVQLKDGAFHIDMGGGENLVLPLSDISSLILNAKQTMELFCGEVLYRIRLLPDACSLKYHEYYLSYSKNGEDKR